jgi:YihY family inner membrane protein
VKPPHDPSRNGSHNEPVPTASALQRRLRAADGFQQRSTPIGFLVGVVKKFGDDRGGQLVAQLAFSAFLSFFPLMLVVVTVTSFMAHRSPSLAEQIRNSAIAEFPVVGAELTNNEHALRGSGLGLIVGFLLLLWGGFGFTNALQDAFLEVWHVPHKDRPPFLTRMKRGTAIICLLIIEVLASVFLGFVGSFIANSRLAGALGLLGGSLVTFAIYLAVFWLLSPKDLLIADLLPGVILASIGWQALQTLGLRLIGSQLRRSSELYGTIGAALGLIAFLYLTSQFLVYSLEVATVRKLRLWPRSVVQPPLTGPDRAMLFLMAKQEERWPEQFVTVTFEAGETGAASQPTSSNQ